MMMLSHATRSLGPYGRQRRGATFVGLATLAVAATVFAVVSPARADVPAPPANKVTHGKTTDEVNGISTLRIGMNRTDNPKVIYSIEAPDLSAAEGLLRIRAEVGVTRCSHTDIQGVGNDNSCVGTHEYNYTPNLHAKVVLGTSDTDTSGTEIVQWEDYRCWASRHHCPKAFKGTLGSAVTGTKYVNLVLSADADGNNPNSNDVVNVENGNGALGVIRIGSNRTGDADNLPFENDERAEQLPIRPEDNVLDKVIYTKELTQVDDGDILAVSADMVTTIPNDYPDDPLVHAKVLLVQNPDSMDVVGDSDVTIARLNGFNCTAHGQGEECLTEKEGTVRVPNDAPGTMYVNLIAGAIRNGNPTNHVNVKKGVGGGIDVTRWRETTP